MPLQQPQRQKTRKLPRIQVLLTVYFLLSCVGLAYFAWLTANSVLLPSSAWQVAGLLLGVVGVGICLLGFYDSSPFPSGGNRRQFLHPAEFRINNIRLPRGVKLDSGTDVTDLCTAYEALEKSCSENRPSYSVGGAGVGGNDQLLFSLCTEIWRLRKKVSAETKRGELSNSQIPRYVERMDRAIESANVVIHDHTGEKYFPGQAVRVISFQRCEDIPKGEERVIETVKPTIYRDGLVVRQGEVVVGTSVTNQENGEKGENKP